jgi:hypothetical protein
VGGGSRKKAGAAERGRRDGRPFARPDPAQADPTAWSVATPKGRGRGMLPASRIGAVCPGRFRAVRNGPSLSLGEAERSPWGDRGRSMPAIRGAWRLPCSAWSWRGRLRERKACARQPEGVATENTGARVEMLGAVCTDVGLSARSLCALKLATGRASGAAVCEKVSRSVPPRGDRGRLKIGYVCVKCWSDNFSITRGNT